MRPLRSLLVLGTAVAGIVGLGASTPAQAGDFSLGITIVSGRPMRTVWVEPVYETRVERVWVEPQNQTVTEQVWHPPVTESRVIDRVWVPDRYVTRDVHTTDRWGRVVIRRESVLAEPAHWEERRTDVVIRPGYHEAVTRQVVVREGGWQTVENRVCVTQGHWASVPAYGYSEHTHVHVGAAPVIVERPLHGGHYHHHADDRSTRGRDADVYRARYDDKYRGDRNRDDDRTRDRSQQRDSQDRGDRYRH